MSNLIKIKKENVLNAYDKATSAQKELLENLFRQGDVSAERYYGAC